MRCLVLGSSDVASAVAHRLFSAGYDVVIHESGWPTATRRGMAFADAVFNGKAGLEGIDAVRLDELSLLAERVRARAAIPLVRSELADLLVAWPPDVLVDARMRKRAIPEPLIGKAKLTIGLGPNFVAGGNVTIAIETAWSEAQGNIIYSGPTLPLAGEPRPIDGHGRDRFIYAPRSGLFHTAHAVGDPVQAGQIVAHIDDMPLHAPLDGALRGLTHDGVPVDLGTKVVEVDPRAADAAFTGIGKRPGRIAEGVMHAVEEWSNT